MIKKLLVWVAIRVPVLACTMAPQTNASKPQITFDVARSILGRFKTQQDVIDNLGKPSEKSSDRSGQESWNYNEAVTGYQPLTITFGADKKTQSVLWIPRDSEQEAKLDRVLTQYRDLKITAIDTREVAPPHDLNTETIYSDNKTISILHNDYVKRVEAISWFVDDGKHLLSSDAQMKRKLVGF